MAASFPIRFSRPSGRQRRSLQITLLLWFLGISLLPLAVVSWVGYRQAALQNRQDVLARLEGVGETNQIALQRFFDRSARELGGQAGSAANRRLLEALSAGLTDSGDDAAVWVRSPQWSQITVDLAAELQVYLEHSPWTDILLADAEGRILYSGFKDPNLGGLLFSGLGAGSPLGAACRQALAEGEPACAPIGADHPLAGPPSGFLIQAMPGGSGQAEGLILFRFTGPDLAARLLGEGLLGPEGRVMLVDEDYHVLGGPPGLLERSAEDPGRWRLAGSEPGYLQGVHRTVRVLDRTLGVLAALPADQKEAGLASLRVAAMAMLVAVSMLVAGAAFLVSRRIVLPIVDLGRMMQRVADGHHIQGHNLSGHNEVGDLQDQFLVMIDRLEEAKQARDRLYRVQQAQFELNEKMRGVEDLKSLSRTILTAIAEHCRAPVGAMYLVHGGRDLELVAHLGLLEEDLPPGRLPPGSGLVGQAAGLGRIQVVRELPEGHLPVRSGLGRSRPRCLIVAPFQSGGATKAVLELGTLAEVGDEEVEFLERCGETVAAALDMARSRDRVNRLLAETKRQAWVLSAQQKELQETNEQLARSGHYKTEFLANMSHELRTPLNSMLLMSQVLAENPRGTMTQEEVDAAQTITLAGQDLLTIINDILDLSMVEAGKLEVRPRDVDLGNLLDHLQGLFTPTAMNQGLEFRVFMGPDVPGTIITDENRLGQVLKNLLNNAFKFTLAGTVVLRVRRPGAHEIERLGVEGPHKWLALSVADTGIGMTSSQMSRVFESFSQGDGSIGRKFGGTGLGLSISRELVQLMGGKITVDSLEGRGSTFTIFLPTQPADLASADADPAEAGGLSAPAAPAAAATAAPQVVCLPHATSPHGRRAEESSADPQGHRKGGLARTKSTATVGWTGQAGLKPDPVWDGWSGRRVLLGDRDMRTVFALNEALLGHGAKVLIGRSWDQCLELARENPGFDLAVLNPELFGGEAGQAVSNWRVRTGSQAPVLALHDSQVPLAGIPGDGVLRKPVSIGDFHIACRELLTREVVPC